MIPRLDRDPVRTILISTVDEDGVKPSKWPHTPSPSSPKSGPRLRQGKGAELRDKVGVVPADSEEPELQSMVQLAGEMW